MIIALDYDGTYTEDPEMWLDVIKRIINSGHRVIVVTMRYPSEGATIDPKLLHICNIVYTSREAKGKFCHQYGIIPNVWIDDNPGAIDKSAEELWGTATPEGDIVSGNAIDLITVTE